MIKRSAYSGNPAKRLYKIKQANRRTNRAKRR